MWLWLVRFFCHAFMSIANQLLICLVSRRELESKKGKGKQANWLESCRHTGGLNVCAMYSCSASQELCWLGMVATGRDEYEGKGTDVERMAAIHKTNTKGLLPSNGRTRGCWALGGRLTF